MIAALTGLLAGIVLGWVLAAGDLCAHATARGLLRGDADRARTWLLGVLSASVGLSVLLLTPLGDGLNEGLALRPVGNIVGGLMVGVGLVVARSCVGGLLFKLGGGMLGATVGLLGWAIGELAARQIDVPGPTVLGGGEGATLPGVLHLPRLTVALLLLALVLGLWRRRGHGASGAGWWRRGWTLGAALTVAWALAGIGGASFGPSSVGAVASVAAGSPNRWLIGFLLGLVVGGLGAARSRGTLHVRGETPPRYAGLLAGGVLLGAGGWIAGGCTLGHGLSGLAQLNLSSALVVAAMVLGVALTAAVAGSVAERRGGRGGPSLGPRADGLDPAR